MPLFNSRLARDIIKYLWNNPQAMDNLEGITRFWVTRQRLTEYVDEIQVVVGELCRRGILHEKAIRDQSGNAVDCYYQLNPALMSQIDSILETLDTSQADTM